MSRFRGYIKPRDNAGNFLSDFIEVTDDIDFDSTGTIKQQLDNDEYNVGQFKFSEFFLKLNNQFGKYSDVDVVQSIFRTRRSGSIFKLTWSPADFPAQCGLAVAGSSVGATISEEKVVFIGVIDDDSSKLDIDEQKITFNVLSTDSIFPSIEARYDLLSVGQNYSDALFAILNIPEVTEYLTVDASNISVGIDLDFDVVDQYQNKTLKEVMDDILFQSNSVLFIKDETIFIKSRDGGLIPKYIFRGQGSNEGPEDIRTISQISSGRNRVFNYWTWKDTTLLAKDDDSIVQNLIRKKEIDIEAITDTSKRQAILNSQRDEFKDKKQGFDLKIAINPKLLDLFMLDQVRVDYPTTFIPAESGGDLPIYGIAIYGQDRYGFGEFSLTVDKDTPYMIVGRNIDTKKQELIFKLEEI